MSKATTTSGRRRPADVDKRSASIDRRFRRRARLIAVALFVGGLVVTLLIASWIQNDASDRAEDRFEESVRQSELGVVRAVEDYFDELRHLGAGLLAYQPSPPEDFEALVAASGIFDELESVVGVIVIEPVSPNDMDAFVEARRIVDPDFAITEIGVAPGTGDHFILTYYVGSGRVDLPLPVGTDISPLLAVSEVLQTASEEGVGAAGSFQNDPLLLQIAEETEFPAIEEILDMDFFMGLPVYSERLAVGEVPTERPVLWMAAPIFAFADVLNSAAEDQATDIGVSLTVDLTETTSQLTEDIELVANLEGEAGPLADATAEKIYPFEVSGVAFTATLWGQPDRSSPALALVLLAGSVASVLGAIVVYLRLLAYEGERTYNAELADREQLQRNILNSVSDPMVVLDSSGEVMATNPAWRSMRQAEEDEEAADLGMRYTAVLAEVVAGPTSGIEGELESVLAGGSAEEVDAAVEQGLHRRWYSIRFTPLGGRRGGAVVVHTDITERKRSEAELELKATHDPLTGLLNRMAIEEEADRAVARARAGQHQVGLLFIDLDGFKFINDNWGHAVGDSVLRDVARRVTSAVRTSDRVGRLGGDEFVVLIEPLPDREAAERTAERILRGLNEPFLSGDDQLPVGASVGVAVVDDPLSGTAAGLIDLADQAMYEAKQAGGGVFRFRS